MTILELIPKGNRNAISRSELVRRSGLTDRIIRRHIAELNNKGIVILNNGNGYFLYGGQEDNQYLNEYVAMEKARVRTISRKIRKMEKARE